MLPEIHNLIQLQEADKTILRLQQEIATLPKKVAAIEEQLAGTKAGLERARAAMKADEASRRKYEGNISDLQQKISKFRDQALGVKTNEQYRALNQEIKFAEDEIRANEDKILELMLNSESREREVKAAEAELKAETAEIEREKTEARRRTEEDEKQLAQWNTTRSALIAGVPENLLRHYERVMKFRGSGIAEVRDHKCMGCQVMLRPQTYNEIRSGETLVTCDSCQRILFFHPQNDEVAVERETVNTRRKRPRPKAEAGQAWFYRPSFGEEGETFLCFINVGTDSVRRVYEMHTGRKIRDTLLREGKYPLAFPEDLTPDSIRLNGHWEEEELEEWGLELPMVVVEALQMDLEAARAESSKGHRAHASAEHPAAS
jgi:predicted  nucleic acid-binding Zn-ribbon protein